MKAAYYDVPGPPDVIRYGEVTTPEPRDGEVRVRVGAAAVNPIDTYIRAGVVKMPLPQPTIPGADLAGTIDAIGPQVKRFRIGDRVWGSNQGLLGRQGTFAEFACVHEDWLYATPAGVSDETAAAVALTGITAHLGLFRCARLQPGETVFVHGGTGGVGSMVVQMAKAAGARVAATVGSPAKVELCRQLGADLILNYRADNVADALGKFTNNRGVNVWYETQRDPDLQFAFELLAPRGRMIVMAGRAAQPVFPLGKFYPRDLSMYGFAMFNATSDEQRTCANDINLWLDEKKVIAVIGRTFALSDASAAHKMQEENTLQKSGTLTGKIIVKP